MFTNLTRETIRWALDVAGLLCLLAACQFHSWTLDGIGVGMLLLATLMGPPLSGLGAKVLVPLAAFLAFVRGVGGKAAEAMVGDGQYIVQFTGPAYAQRSTWDLADSAYVQAIIKAESPQLSFPFMGQTEKAEAPRCIYSVTPCGRTTAVRAWGDLH